MSKYLLVIVYLLKWSNKEKHSNINGFTLYLSICESLTEGWSSIPTIGEGNTADIPYLVFPDSCVEIFDLGIFFELVFCSAEGALGKAIRLGLFLKVCCQHGITVGLQLVNDPFLAILTAGSRDIESGFLLVFAIPFP